MLEFELTEAHSHECQEDSKRKANIFRGILTQLHQDVIDIARLNM